MESRAGIPPGLILALCLAVATQLLPAASGFYNDAYVNDYPDQRHPCGVAPLNGRSNSTGRGRRSRAPYILNGTTAYYGEWPFLAMIRFTDDYYCGATIVRPDLIVTAGHCLKHITPHLGKYYDISDGQWFGPPISVLVGKVSRLQTDQHEKRHTVKAMQMGAFYKQRDYLLTGPDFARVWLNEPIEFNDYVRPVCVPRKPEMVDRLSQLRPLYTTGYGCKDEGAKTDRAHQLELRRVPCQDTKYRFPGQLDEDDSQTPAEGCFLAADGGNRAICDLDSGSPLVALDENRRWSLVGVAIESYECNPKLRAAPANIFTLMTSIVDILKKNFQPGSGWDCALENDHDPGRTPEGVWTNPNPENLPEKPPKKGRWWWFGRSSWAGAGSLSPPAVIN